jgi:hypothetical protein
MRPSQRRTRPSLDFIGPPFLGSVPALAVGALDWRIGLAVWVGSSLVFYRLCRPRVIVTDGAGNRREIDPSQSSLEEMFDPCRPTSTRPLDTQT